MKSEMQCKVPV